MSRPNHFEIPVDEPDRAEKFYAEVFGWTFQRYDGAPEYYGMTTTGDDGGKVVQDNTAIPSMGWFATCEDSEGNKVGLYKDDSSAV